MDNILLDKEVVSIYYIITHIVLNELHFLLLLSNTFFKQDCKHIFFQTMQMYAASLNIKYKNTYVSITFKTFRI